MNWDMQILKENDIEQIYLDLINEYGMKLPDNQKKIAKELFQDLYDKGKTWEWIYWAIWQLGERKVVNNKGLFFYSDYQREVEDIVRYANEYHFTGLTFEQYMEDYVQWLVLYEKDYIEKSLYDRLAYFDDKYWNSDEVFTYDEFEELKKHYIDMVKDLLKVSREEYEQEQRSIAKELRRVFGRVIDVIPHPYVNLENYM